jgi:hypothetical protein
MAAVPVLRGSETDPEALISRARKVLMTADAGREAITKALADVLDASLQILPKTDYAEEFRTRIETVKKMFENQVLFSDKGRQYLGLAYKLVSGGKAWEVPAELKASGPDRKGIEKAVEICANLLESALAERKAGRNEQAVSYLLNFVILVITPIEA